MPILTDETMEGRSIGGSNYNYSGKRLKDLGADSYTLGTIALDVTGSVWGHEKAIEGVLKACIVACRDNPRADNTMLRVILFSSRFPNGIEEVHGFKPLPEINESDYDGVISCGGGTPLLDAAYNGCGAIGDYAKDLLDHDYGVNGICFVVTDGDENTSVVGFQTVKQEVASLVTGERLESFRPVLVGINTRATQGLTTTLQKFKDEAGFDQYVDIGKATPKELARLGEWLSVSISSQSQALGSNGPSKSVSF